MTEELAFARKASGLVRGISMTDAFTMGLMFVVPIYTTWYAIQVGLGLFSGANIIIGMIIAFVTFAIPAVFVWSTLSASMPRSGGEYIYNSRILFPSIAMGASFCMIVGQLYWNMYEGTWMANPAAQLLAGFTGWQGLGTFASSKGGMIFFGCLTWVLAFLLVAFGLRVFRRIAVWLMIGGIILTGFFGVIIAFCSKASFIHNWNVAAAHYHSLPYNQFLVAVQKASGSTMPSTWNWHDTAAFAVTGVFQFFIYAYAMNYVSGEVKRPDKSLLLSNAMAVGVAFVLGMIAFVALYHAVAFKFLSATAYSDLFGGVKGYNLPYSSSYMAISFLAAGGNRVVGVLIGLTWIVCTITLCAIILTVMQRVMFAWGMDRMGPKEFTSIGSRFGAPWRMYAFIAGLSMVLTIVYILWLSNALSGLVASGMMVVSVFSVTAISAILLPYRKRARGIWDSSPYRRWMIGKVPVVTIAGVIYLGYLVVLIYFSFLDVKTRDTTGKKLILFGVVWIIGMLWFYGWRWWNQRRHGIDAALTYRALPPE